MRARRSIVFEIDSALEEGGELGGWVRVEHEEPDELRLQEVRLASRAFVA